MARNGKKSYSIGQATKAALGNHHVMMPRYSWCSACKSRYAISQQRGKAWDHSKSQMLSATPVPHKMSQISPVLNTMIANQTSSPVHRLPSIHPVYLKHLKPFTTLHYPSLPRSFTHPLFLHVSEAWQHLLARQHFEYLQTSLEDPGNGWLGQEAAGDSPGRTGRKWRQTSMFFSCSHGWHEASHIDVQLPWNGYGVQWSYSPITGIWTCCVSASKIIKIMVKEKVTMSPFAVDFGDHFPIPTGTPMVLESCCCRACDLFKTHWSCRAAWGGLEGWTRLGGCGLMFSTMRQ